MSFGPPLIECLRNDLGDDVFFDVHVMVTHPFSLIEALKRAKTNMVTFHMECPQVNEMGLTQLCKKIISNGIKAGIAISPGSKISEEIVQCISDSLISMVNVMTVGIFFISNKEPGFGGQNFKEYPLEKVKFLRTKFPDLDIQVDGGIKTSNVGIAADSGANVIVCGTGIIHAEDQKGYIQDLKDKIDQGKKKW